MKKKQYVLRNGIVVEPTGDLLGENIQVISVPKDYKGPWKKGQKDILVIGYPELERVLSWTGGAYGKGYDVVRELEGG